MLSTSLLVSASAFATLVSSQFGPPLTKPLINPPFPSLDGRLWDVLKPTQSTHDQWGAGWIPQGCKTIAEREKFNPSDFEVFNIHYTDCDAVWVFCRHKNAQFSQINMIDVFGRLPVRVRGFVRHMVAVPGADSAYNDADNILIQGNGAHPTLFAHEAGHSVDGNAFLAWGTPKNQRFSLQQRWIDQYNMDSAVSDGYAAHNQVENFAQEFVIALFDVNVPGGIGTVQPSWNSIFHQYFTIREFLAPERILNPDGRCTFRWENSPAVPMVNGARIAGSAPDASIPAGIRILPNVRVSEFPEAENVTSIVY